MPKPKATKPLVRYAVLVNDEMVRDSWSSTREGAESYLGGARRYATGGAVVRVVRLTVRDIPQRSRQ